MVKTFYSTPITSLDISNEARRLVSNNIKRILTGTTEILSSPILQSFSELEILKGWDQIVKVNSNVINPVLMEMELSNRSKVGPSSKAKPWSERREEFFESFGDSELGKDLRADISKPFQLRPLSYEKAIPYLKNSTSSGLPFMLKKVNVKGIVLGIMDKLLKSSYPAILFTRTQFGGKTRDIVCFGIADTILEMCYYRPLLEYQRRLPWRSALSEPDVIDTALTKLINTAKEHKLKIVSIDFKSYDKTIKGGLQFAGFNYIKTLFQKSHHAVIDQIALRFKTIPIVTPEGIIHGAHGVPSGSVFTNEIDSIVQYLVALSCKVVEYINLCQIQGDDGVYLTSDPDELFRCFTKYGLKVSRDKTVVSDDYAVYLQSLYHSDYMRDGRYVGVYPTYRALGKILYLEKFQDFSKDEISGADYFAIRTISILENCKHHPLHKELVLYVLSRDKYKLQFSEQGLKNYISRIARQESKDVNFRLSLIHI